MITEVMKISEPPYTNRGVTRQKEDLTALIDWCQITVKGVARLEALRAVNPNIRDDELTAIESNRQQVMESLDQAGWRLDALRLIVVTHQ